jgi:serine/threonine-protein kinase RsbW
MTGRSHQLGRAGKRIGRAIAERDCSHDHPISRFPDSVLISHRELIPSDTQHIDGAVGRAIDLVEESGCCQDVGDIRLALHEALMNAIIHGNHRDPAKYVRMSVAIKAGGELIITVEDSGSGFDPTKLPDPTAGENIYRECGRGVYLIQRLMDEVEYKFQDGTVLTMRCRPPKRQP